jgi:hypothetical protein
MPTKRARILEDREEEDTTSPGKPDDGSAEPESAHVGFTAPDDEEPQPTDTHVEPTTDIVHSQTPGNEASSLASDPSE